MGERYDDPWDFTVTWAPERGRLPYAVQHLFRHRSERDARINAWLADIHPGDIVTVRLNSTDTLTGKVYEAPDSSQRIALYVFTTLLRYGNGYPGGSFEPVLALPEVAELRGQVERVRALAQRWDEYGEPAAEPLLAALASSSATEPESAS